MITSGIPTSHAVTDYTGSINPLRWQYMHGFGERDMSVVTNQDVLSHISFDRSGKYLGVGDRGGRFIIFERTGTSYDFDYYSEFQSHEAEFDYLKSVEIDEHINAAEWLNMYSQDLLVLTANDKTIKLWRIFEKTEGTRQRYNCDKRGKLNPVITDAKHLKIPKTVNSRKNPTSQYKREYSYGQNYHIHINSLSLSRDGENFISADDLRVNLWNINRPLDIFNVVDIKPNKMDQLNEVITSAAFHPIRPDLFVYSTSKGFANICDFRQYSHFTKPTLQMSTLNPGAKKNFFSEIICSVSNAKFAKDGSYVATRDYVSIKIWDVRNLEKPYRVLKLCDFIEPKLCDLYENQAIYDKFQLEVSPCSRYVLSGSYGDKVHIIDKNQSANATLSANFDQKKGRNLGYIRQYGDKKGMLGGKSGAHTDPSSINFNKKVQHLSWHPTENLVALANHNCIFMFKGT